MYKGIITNIDIMLLMNMSGMDIEIVIPKFLGPLILLHPASMRFFDSSRSISGVLLANFTNFPLPKYSHESFYYNIIKQIRISTPQKL